MEYVGESAVCRIWEKMINVLKKVSCLWDMGFGAEEK